MRGRTALLTISILSVSLAAQALDGRIANARSTYETQLVLIANSGSDASADWTYAYKADLSALKTSFQSNGDLEGLLAVQNEINRFDMNLTLAADSLVAEPAALAQLQKKYRSQTNVGSSKSKALVELVGKYVGHLENLKKDLTIAGDVESAIAVKKEIEDVQSSAEFLAAKQEAASTQVKKQDPAPVVPPRTQEVTPGQAPQAAQSADPVAPSGYIVYPQGKTPPNVPGIVFTRIALTSSGNAPLAARFVSVVASRSLDSKVSRDSSYYSSKQTTKTAVVRLFVRHTSSSSALKNLTLNIQFFNKSLDQSGNVEPARISAGTIKIPELTSDGFYIDCPEVSATSSISTGYNWSNTSGKEFYGILVSVYDGDGSLSYQGISGSALKSAAAAAVTRSERDTLMEELDRVRSARDAARSAYYASSSDPILREAYDKASTEYYEVERKISALRE